MRLVGFLTLLIFTGFARAADVEPTKNAGPYIPSPEAAVEAMLRYAHVGPDDFLIDLGSGDGRIVRTAAKVFGARGVGVEIKESLVKHANDEAKKEGIADRVKFLKQDLFKTDISQATVVTMYLLPDTVNMLREKLANELKPGTRIVSHDYPLTGWLPEDMKQFDLPEKEAISGVQTTIVWLYVVLNGKEVPLEDVKLRGDRLSFKLAGHKGEFTGQVKGSSIEGTLDSGGTKTPWSAALSG